ncbi:MAG: hypothetical protein ACRD3S_01485 [Terracidiphilus sp.]
MNVEFEYVYRDLGNFKNYSSVIFGNQNNLRVEEIHRRVSQILGNDPTFYASLVGIPEMFFQQFPYDPELDWPMHEYSGVSETEMSVSDAKRRDIEELLLQLRNAAK